MLVRYSFERGLMKVTPSLEELIEALGCLPGVGPKSAQRMAYYLLQHDREGATRLVNALGECLASVRHCEKCNNFTEEVDWATPSCSLPLPPTDNGVRGSIIITLKCRNCMDGREWIHHNRPKTPTPRIQPTEGKKTKRKQNKTKKRERS